MSYNVTTNYSPLIDFNLSIYQSQIFPCGRVHTSVWMHHLDANKAYREKPWRKLHSDAMSNIKRILEATSHKTAVVWPPITHL